MKALRTSMMRRGRAPMSMCRGASSAPRLCTLGAVTGSARGMISFSVVTTGPLVGMGAFVAVESLRFLPNMLFFFFCSFSGALPLLLKLLAVLGREEAFEREGASAMAPGCEPGTEYHVERFEGSNGIEKSALSAWVSGGRRSRISS